MLATAMPPEMLKGLRPDFIAPFVGILTARNVSPSDLVAYRVELISRDPMSTVVSLSLRVDITRNFDTKGQRVQSGRRMTRSLPLPSLPSGMKLETLTVPNTPSTPRMEICWSVPLILGSSDRADADVGSAQKVASLANKPPILARHRLQGQDSCHYRCWSWSRPSIRSDVWKARCQCRHQRCYQGARRKGRSGGQGW
jgi:hypothetical protein